MKHDIHILIVDDDEDDIDMLNWALKKISATTKVTVANNGAEAIQQLKTKEKPDVIVLDVNMPMMNGYECLEIMEKIKLVKDVAVIVYSTSKNQDNANRCLKLGADYFVSKPNTVNAIEALAANILDGRYSKRTGRYH